jgi:hypothetical protein
MAFFSTCFLFCAHFLVKRDLSPPISFCSTILHLGQSNPKILSVSQRWNSDYQPPCSWAFFDRLKASAPVCLSPCLKHAFFYNLYFTSQKIMVSEKFFEQTTGSHLLASTSTYHLLIRYKLLKQPKKAQYCLKQAGGWGEYN